MSTRGREPVFLCQFALYGTVPVPQGSKKAFVIRGTNRAVLTDDNATKLKPWREAVAQEAATAMALQGLAAIQKGAIRVSVRFEFPFLKSHFKSDGVTLRDDYPLYKESKPDTDKLCRALGDALSGVCYRDDAQIAEWHAVRIYSSIVGVTVKVYAL
jgi:crossover junction endodeoxyribonuclease RusA